MRWCSGLTPRSTVLSRRRGSCHSRRDVCSHASRFTTADVSFHPSIWDIESALFNDTLFLTEQPDGYEAIELLEELGQGSFGIVFRGIDALTGEAVAVKRMAVRGNGTPGSRIRPHKIAQEVDILKRLADCPSVAAFKRHLCNATTESIITELCSGGNLEEYLTRNGPLNEVQLTEVAKEAASVLYVCHDRKILHGDIKATNFVISSPNDTSRFTHDPLTLEPGWLKLVDFGSSLPMGLTLSHFHPLSLCIASTVGKSACTYKIGTPTHWSPEVFAQRFELPADMWSFGTMLYRLASHRMPFYTRDEERSFRRESDLLLAILQRPAEFEEPPWDNFSDTAKHFISRCLQLGAEKRMTAAEALSHPFLNNHERQNE